MKKNLIKLMMVAVIVVGAALSASSQIYVKVRPTYQRTYRSDRPTRAHVWIGEEWNVDGANYRYSGSRWETPPNHGDHWRRGHWSHHRGYGDQWVSGHWRSRRY